MAIAWCAELEPEEDLAEGTSLQRALMSAATWFVKNHDRAPLFYPSARAKLVAQCQLLETTSTSLYGVLVDLVEALRPLYLGELPMGVVTTVQQQAAWYQHHKAEGMSVERRVDFLTEAVARQFQVLRVCAQAIEALEQQQTAAILREGMEHVQRAS